MKEYGGYIELDTYHLPLLHEGAVALNAGRNALAYLIRGRKIRKIRLPLFLCSSVPEVCEREGIEIGYYHIGEDLRPARLDPLEEGEWLYLVNYYGQMDNAELSAYADAFTRVIVDQANAYFQLPLPHVDTLYTCRKWFGVADGAFLYTDAVLDEEFPRDESFERMHFLLGRFERSASEFYSEYTENNHFFVNEPIKRMSRLTENLLRGIDYKAVEKTRVRNFEVLHEVLGPQNPLDLKTASFMYPFMTTGGMAVKKVLQQKKIYIPTLWPSVFDMTGENDVEYRLAADILPLPIDQRYTEEDMRYIAENVKECLS